MSPPPAPTPEPSQPLLWAAYRENLRLREHLATARQRIAELTRSLGEAAAELDHLRQQYAATGEELALLRRKLYGRSGEREVTPQERPDSPEPSPPGAPAGPATGPDESGGAVPSSPRRPRRARRLDLSRLPHVRHLEDLPAAEKVCGGWAAEHAESVLSDRLEEARSRAKRKRERRQHRRDQQMVG